jgi:hypothetical protein
MEPLFALIQSHSAAAALGREPTPRREPEVAPIVISDMRIEARAALFLALLVAQACGSLTGSSRTSPSASARPTAFVQIIITAADDSRTMTAHVGDRIQVALGEQYNWQLDPPDGVVLTQPIQSYPLVRGTQAIWLATTVGQSNVRATATAVCPYVQACPPSARVFSTTVVVVP